MRANNPRYYLQMVRLAVFGAVLLSTAKAQRQELGLTLGGLLSQQRSANQGRLDLGSGLALQANYGYRLLRGERVAVYLETHFLANGLRDIRSVNTNVTRDVATIFVTPGLRVKFFPTRTISPFAAVGGGYALYEQSTATIRGGPNPAPRFTHRGAFDFGGGVDAPLWRFIGLRAEIRDFYTGNPSFNGSERESDRTPVVTQLARPSVPR